MPEVARVCTPPGKQIIHALNNPANYTLLAAVHSVAEVRKLAENMGRCDPRFGSIPMQPDPVVE